jgi:hypothetical protein
MNPKEIFYLSDVLRPDTFSNVCSLLEKPIWQFGRVTNPDAWDEDSTVFWQADLTLNNMVGDVAFYEILSNLNKLAPSTASYQFKLYSAIAGGKTFGLDGGIHTDKDFIWNDMGDGFMTLCFFPNKEWSPEWGGEFQFFDENGNVIATYYPMPNTCIVFDSDIPHRGLGPSRDCKKLRQYISFKTFVSKRWYLNNDPGLVQLTDIQG